MRALLPGCLLALVLFLLGACPKSGDGQPTAVTAEPKQPPQAPAPKPALRPREAVPERPIVALSTTLGVIKLELFPKKAPLTVANFLGYVRSGHYNGTIFHRVIRDFMIQAGGYTAAHVEKPSGESIQNEASSGLSNARGTVAMARTANPHSATAEFFINVVDNPRLDFKAKTLEGWGYCVFGKVIEGMDVVDKIRDAPTGPKQPFEKDCPRVAIVINEAKLGGQ